MSTRTSLIFSPTPEVAHAVFTDIADPDLSLRQVAQRHNTTLPALSAWLTTDEARAHFTNLSEAAAARTRTLADTQMVGAVAVASTVLHEAHALLRTGPRPPDPAAHPELSPDEILRAFEARRRLCESARRASNHMLRLARYRPDLSTTPPPPRTQRPRRPDLADEALLEQLAALRAQPTAATPPATDIQRSPAPRPATQPTFIALNTSISPPTASVDLLSEFVPAAQPSRQNTTARRGVGQLLSRSGCAAAPLSVPP